MSKEKKYAFVNYCVDCEWYGCNESKARIASIIAGKKYGFGEEYGVQEVWEDKDGEDLDGLNLEEEGYTFCYNWIEDKDGNRIPLNGNDGSYKLLLLLYEISDEYFSEKTDDNSKEFLGHMIDYIDKVLND